MRQYGYRHALTLALTASCDAVETDLNPTLAPAAVFGLLQLHVADAVVLGGFVSSFFFFGLRVPEGVKEYFGRKLPPFSLHASCTPRFAFAFPFPTPTFFLV